MEVISDLEAYRAACEDARRAGKKVGLVPTMGALHEGHLKLVDAAKDAGCSYNVVTIFVNPLQFVEGEDLSAYPRTLQSDLDKCRARGVALVFVPDNAAMYPPDYQTRVVPGALGAPLEGIHRPEHFGGVVTVCTKLFILTGACVTVFGRKDYQQWRIITQLVRDFNLPIEVIGHPIVREEDGLAMSSRNKYLQSDERIRARALSQAWLAARKLYNAGERDIASLEKAATDVLVDKVDTIDYVKLCDAHTLGPPDTNKKMVLAITAYVGKARLLDNTVLGEVDPWTAPQNN